MNQPETLVELAFREIRSRIQNGTYPPGTKLSTQEISDSLGISRTPVVSAVNRLVAQGLAKSVPRRGVIVADITPQMLREITEVRQMIEIYAVKSAIFNIDFYPHVLEEMEHICDELDSLSNTEYSRAAELENRFHTLFVSLASNSQLTKIYEDNWGIGSIFYMFSLSKMPVYKHKLSGKQHREMIQFLQNGDEDALINTIQQHLKNAFNTIDWLSRNESNGMPELWKTK